MKTLLITLITFCIFSISLVAQDTAPAADEAAAPADTAAVEAGDTNAIAGDTNAEAGSNVEPPPPPPPPAPGVGEKAPLFALDSITYERFVMADVLEELEDMEGVIVLAFWASWCAPCKLEIPVFERIYEDIEDAESRLYTISIDAARKDVWQYSKIQNNFSVPILWDQNAANAGIKYGANTVLPQLFIVDYEGNIRFKHIGGIKNIEDVIKCEIEKIRPGSFPDKKGVVLQPGEKSSK